MAHLPLDHAILEAEVIMEEQCYHFLLSQCRLLNSPCLVLAPLSSHPPHSTQVTSAHPPASLLPTPRLPRPACLPPSQAVPLVPCPFLFMGLPPLSSHICRHLLEPTYNYGLQLRARHGPQESHSSFSSLPCQAFHILPAPSTNSSDCLPVPILLLISKEWKSGSLAGI